MSRLAGIDAAFLYLETPSAHMHVVATIVVEPPPAAIHHPGRLGHHVGRRLAAIPRFRQRLVEVPLGLDHPRLSDDPWFRVERHLHQRHLPAPASDATVAEAVARIASRPLPRDRALWELWELHGLAADRVALVLKVHHAAIDGVAGMELMAHLFDLERTPPPAPRAARPASVSPPSLVDIVVPALSAAAAWPFAFARTLGHSAGALVRVLDRVLASGATLPSPTMPLEAPRTVFNMAISPERAVAFATMPLAEIKAARARLGATVNDVVLMLCTMSLRRFLAAHGGIPDRALVASIPVAVGSGPIASFNHVSAMFVGLPVHLDDPRMQLRYITQHAARAKDLHQASGGRLLEEWAELAPPRLLAEAARLFSRWRLAERLQPIHNLVISNVAGPQVPLYVAGARVRSVYPLGPVLEGAGLNLTVISYDGMACVGVVTCRCAVRDPSPIANGCVEALAEVGALAVAPAAASGQATGAGG